MIEDKLKVIEVSSKEEKSSRAQKASRRDEARAIFERKWLLDPLQFNPTSDALRRECLERTWRLIKNSLDLHEKAVIDLGCGEGVLSIRLAHAGAVVTAVDIASNVLQTLQAQETANLITQLEYVPRTTFSDNTFDLVIAKDLIAYLPEKEFRLFFSELARLVKAEGFVLAATPIDIDSSDSLQRFILLAETEFNVEKWVFGYSAFYIRILRCLSMPANYLRAHEDTEYYQQELKNRKGISKIWFLFNISPVPLLFWKIVSSMLKPVVHYLQQSRRIMLALEKICSALSPTNGISYALFIGKRRPLVEPVTEEAKPFERPRKERIWE